MPESLNELVRQRRVIPFLGAGFSAVAGFPGWFGLLRRVYDGIIRDGDFDAVVEACGRDPLRVAEYVLIRSGGNVGPIRHQMTSALRTPEPFVSSAHVDLANLHLPVIYTTNFDELVEATYGSLGIRADVCCNVRDLMLARASHPQLVKFHGDLRYDETLVLTESSFQSRLDFESPLDLKFRGDILGRSLLFVGYGFADINIRALWYKLSKLMASVPTDERPPSFIVRLAPNPILAALDGAVGLTTITLDPEGRADSPLKRQRLLEKFMLELTFTVDYETNLNDGHVPPFCSPALLEAAAAIVQSAPQKLGSLNEVILEAVASRQLHAQVKPTADRLLGIFAERRPSGPLGDHRRAITLNYVMSYGQSDQIGKDYA